MDFDNVMLSEEIQIQIPNTFANNLFEEKRKLFIVTYKPKTHRNLKTNKRKVQQIMRDLRKITEISRVEVVITDLPKFCKTWVKPMTHR